MTSRPPPTNGAAGFAFRQPDEDTTTPLLIRHISDYGFRTDAAYLNNPTRKVMGMSTDRIAEGLTASTLEAKWKSNFQWQERNPFNNRMRRAASWLTRAEQERDDPDAAFIFHWIAFNAIYAEQQRGVDDGEQDIFEDYFTKIAPLDTGGVVYNAIWMKFNGPIKALLSNQFIFKPFWKGAANWKQQFDESQSHIEQELLNRSTKAILVRMFDRLYVLRNQLLHGGATW